MSILPINIANSFGVLNNRWSMKYIIDESKLNTIYSFNICQSTFAEDLSKFQTNPADWIQSLRYFPINLKDYYNLTQSDEVNMKIANKELKDEYQQVIKAYSITDEIYAGFGSTILYGGVEPHAFPSPFGNFLDFKCEYTLYLPYYSFVTLNPQQFHNRYIQINFILDIDSGTGTYFIYSASKSDTNDVYVVASYNCKVSVDIPFIANNSREIASNIRKMYMNTAISTASSVGQLALGNPFSATQAVSGLSSMASNTMNTYLSSQLKPDSVSSMGGNALDLINPQSIYMVIKKPRISYIDNYAHTYGYPLQQTRVLEELSGFTKVADVHMVGFDDATTEEIQQIESLLRNGVIL